MSHLFALPPVHPLMWAFVATYLCYSLLQWAAAARIWRSKQAVLGALLAACAGMSVFIFHFGNVQFAGCDFGTIIDIGWRQVIGQIPHRDFLCTAPPAFYLGMKYAFRIFGTQWNSMLYLTALFASASCLWIYALLRGLLDDPPVAFALALLVESSTMLITDFWWYNNIAGVSAAILLLSCLVYLRKEDQRWAAVSYVASLALLVLMKPNIALAAGTGFCLMLLLGVARRAKLIGLTALAMALAVALLAVNRVSVLDVIASYRGIAAERGGLSVSRLAILTSGDLLRVKICMIAFAAPFVGWIPQLRAAFLRDSLLSERLRTLSYYLLLLCAPAVSLVGALSNFDLKDPEWPVWICAAVLLLHGWGPLLLKRFFTCFLIVLAACQLYFGVTRYRVASAGSPYEARVPTLRPGIPFFRDMQASPRFERQVSEIADVLRTNPGPFFFGPRLEFAYAAFELPSPLHYPVWWEAGVWFPRRDEHAILENWQEQRFRTLIFAKNDYTYYTLGFRVMIDEQYIKDERQLDLTLYHLKAGH